MRTRVLWLFALCPWLTLVHAQTGSELVDPFIGTGKAGNCYPGAQAPFGMISWSPGNVFNSYDDPYARPGYKYLQDSINGFSVTHIDGVGCPAAQDLCVMPYTGPLTGSPVADRRIYASRFRHDEERASPGYYEVRLDDFKTSVELAVRDRSGLGKFSFPAVEDAHVIFRPTNSAARLVDASMKIDRNLGRVTGWVISGGFCSDKPLSSPYKLYFVAEFNRPIAGFGIWKGETLVTGVKEARGGDVAAYLTFDCRKAGSVCMRIGLSYVGERNAARNLSAEIPGWDLAVVRRATGREWTKILGRVAIEGPSDEKKVFFTALYHNLLQPSIFEDVNGEYTGFDDSVHTVPSGHHKYVNFSLWDTYRTTAQLQALLVPERASDMAASLLLDLEQGNPAGFPIWGFYNRETWIMNGYSAIPFIANVYAFGADGFDLVRMKDRTVWAADNKYPRGEKYAAHGYVPDTASHWNYGVSMTLEYSIADFCAARLCLAAGDSSGFRRLLARAQSVFKLFNPLTGYLQRRAEDGHWVFPFDPSVEEGFNEGNSAQYTWSIPHNFAALVDSFGGKVAAEERLDRFFSRILIDGWNVNQPCYWMGNEPCFGVPFLYNWTGQPWKSQELAKRVARSFTPTPDGLPGDDDVGAMSAMYVFSALGLYPSIPGVGGLVVTGPVFQGVTMRLGGNRTLHITAADADSLHPYIRSMSVNGEPYTRTWLPTSMIGPNTSIAFVMSGEPDKEWGSKAGEAPPSFAGPGQ